MPGLDGTGPRGLGPMTGGGRGFRQSFGGSGLRPRGRGYARYGARPVYPENMPVASSVELG